MKLLLLLVVAVYLCLETVARESHRKPDLGTMSKVFKKGVVRLCRGVQLLDDVEVSQVTTPPNEITAIPDAIVPRNVPDPIHNDDSDHDHIDTATAIDLLDSGLMGLLTDVCDKEIVPDEIDASRNHHSKYNQWEGKHENGGRGRVGGRKHEYGGGGRAGGRNHEYGGGGGGWAAGRNHDNGGGGWAGDRNHDNGGGGRAGGRGGFRSSGRMQGMGRMRKGRSAGDSMGMGDGWMGSGPMDGGSEERHGVHGKNEGKGQMGSAHSEKAPAGNGIPTAGHGMPAADKINNLKLRIVVITEKLCRIAKRIEDLLDQENGSEEPDLPDLLLPCNFLEDWHEEHDSAARVDQGAESLTSGPVSTVPATTALPLESTTDLPLPFTTELPPSDHAVAEKPEFVDRLFDICEEMGNPNEDVFETLYDIPQLGIEAVNLVKEELSTACADLVDLIKRRRK